MTSIEMIEFIDEFLRDQEDVLHGIEGRDCTKSRKYLEDIKEQLLIQRVTFCLPIEGDTFESWHHRYFTMNTDGSVVAIKNETIRYTRDQILELWNFLTDRWLAN